MGVPWGRAQRPRFTDTPKTETVTKYSLHFYVTTHTHYLMEYLTCVWGNALMSTSIVAALLLVGAVAVIGAELSTQPRSPAPARTHSWLG